MQSPNDDVELSFDAARQAAVVIITPASGEWEPEEITHVPSFPVADIHGHLAKYPEHHEEDKSVDEEPNHSHKRSMLMIALSIFKYTYSMVLLIFCLVVVMAAIFQNQTVATANMNIPPAAAFMVFWFLIVWLATMEGGQGALVGLQPIDKTLYAESHPRALKCTKLAHRGDNMERFIVGRQLLVVLVVFITNMMAWAVANAAVLGLPSVLNEVFLSSGLGLIIITITIGQLTAQVNAANCMLDFINNYFMLFTVYVSLFIEASGLLHSVYLVQIFFAFVTKTPIESDEPPRSTWQKTFFWCRVLMSVVILSFCFAVTLAALFQEKTLMWSSVPPGASVVIFFLLMAFVGMMEGMQIALFAVVNLKEEELKKHAMAHRACQLAFKGHNLQAFLIGRQICVTVCMFVVARITSLNVTLGTGENIFGVSDGLQQFFNTGLLGAVITTIVGSLMWRIIASSFSVAFLSNPLVYLILHVCLVLEKTGICSAAWLLAFLHKKIVHYQKDKVYIGTPDDRTASGSDLELDEENGLKVEQAPEQAL